MGYSQQPTEPLHIPVEIVSDEEMALIEAALAATAGPAISPVRFQRTARSIQSITLLSKRRLSSETGPIGDIEDAVGFRPTQKRSRPAYSFLHRFRRKRGLSVTDITATEWCEKQMEFFLLLGKPEATKAMKAGVARHAVLEEEVVRRVKVRVKTPEDAWALKFINFMVGVNQLLFDGLTRELPLLGFVEGIWMVGVIDEIRMPVTETEKSPTLVDTKTRARASLPSEPQRRNGRLQLMCYKYLWDNLAADKFPSRQFFDFFALNPHWILSEDIRENTARSGFPAETLDDLIRYFRNACRTLPQAHEQLLLRYELQEDHSLLNEDQFEYDSDWLKGQIQGSLEFWMGEREAKYTPAEERWKCKFCQFASVCPINTNNSDGNST
ncbi:exonuclease V, chloroplastic [Diospyros lotus]|uniref:exonuclease V, chloroplastic n=1 Tax=Diospyros lotus TaxID=55363 RepID=UPI0022528AE7|nr:exonuclease V, chloroplastic [Diospyros lotus]